MKKIRIEMKRYRSAITGRFMTKKLAKQEPATSVSESTGRAFTINLNDNPVSQFTAFTHCQACGKSMRTDDAVCPHCQSEPDDGENGVPA